MDYNVGLPAESALSMNLYYNTNDEEKRRMFPIGPIIGRTSVPESDSVATTRRVRFREDVAERDGVCVLSGFEPVLLRRCAPRGPSQGRLGMLLLLSIRPCSSS